MRVGIVGYGVVGHALERILRRGSHDIAIYDKFKRPFDGDDLKVEINRCDLVFLAVCTDQKPETGECNLLEVDECVSWILPPICIKSTIIPGTVEKLCREYGKPIAFSPEYLGEHPNHPWREIDSAGFVIVGGDTQIQDLVISVLQTCVNREVQFYRASATTAELCKYMENCFLATKLAFVNQFFEIAKVHGIEFETLRELWLLDSRVGRSHTEVRGNGAFGGKCLPKDLRAIIAAMKERGGAPLLEAVSNYNDLLKSRARPKSSPDSEEHCRGAANR
jgi:UDPglucose 6-dehydrogenase